MGKCIISVNHQTFKPKKGVLPLDVDSSNMTVEKTGSAGNFTHMTAAQQFELEKTCLLSLQKNYEDIFNINYYPFPVLINSNTGKRRMVISYCCESIHNLIRADQTFSEKYFFNIRDSKFLHNINDQIDNILFNLNKNNIFYLDLKAANVCISPLGYISLIDFGKVQVSEPNAEEITFLYKFRPTRTKKIGPRCIKRTKLFKRMKWKFNIIMQDLKTHIYGK